MTTARKLLVLAFALAAFLGTNLNTAAFAHDKVHHGVESTVVIEGTPQAVFEAIQESRVKEPHRRKLVSHHENVALIEEHFSELPLIGNAQCTYREVETPYKRIDFSMITSEKLKSFEGSWVLTPVGNGERTQVTLNTFSEPRTFLPFANQVACSSILKDIRRRLENLKSWVETPDGRSIASRPQLEANSSEANKSIKNSDKSPD